MNHQDVTAIGVEYQHALRVGTPAVYFRAILLHLGRTDKRPGSDKLLFERLLLGDGVARQRDKSKTQYCHRAHRELAKSIHGSPPFDFGARRRAGDALPLVLENGLRASRWAA